MTERGEIVVDLRTLKANALKFKRRINGAELIGVVKPTGTDTARKNSRIRRRIRFFCGGDCRRRRKVARRNRKARVSARLRRTRKAVENSLIVSVWDKSQIKELSEIAAAKGRTAQVDRGRYGYEQNRR